MTGLCDISAKLFWRSGSLPNGAGGYLEVRHQSRMALSDDRGSEAMTSNCNDFTVQTRRLFISTNKKIGTVHCIIAFARPV
jgi:hypothetical protein